MLTITDTAHDGTVALALAGELDIATSPDLVAAVEKVRDATTVLLDRTDLRFCDAAGVTALLEARAAARSAGIDLRLVDVRGLAHRVLSICGVLPILTGAPPGRGEVGAWSRSPGRRAAADPAAAAGRAAQERLTRPSQDQRGMASPSGTSSADAW